MGMAYEDWPLEGQPMSKPCREHGFHKLLSLMTFDEEASVVLDTCLTHGNECVGTSDVIRLLHSHRMLEGVLFLSVAIGLRSHRRIGDSRHRT